MGNRPKVYFIMITIVSSGVFILSGCGKRINTTKITGSDKPVISQEASHETVSEPPMPKIEETKEAELPVTPDKGNISSISSARPAGIVSSINDIFFDFDKYIIRDNLKKTLMDNSNLLKGRQLKKIVIEGHCDERGTTDYNLALGERRADATKRYLSSLGVDSSKIFIITFGKEKPFCKEHNEDCWQNNRRAHFVVTN